MYYLGGDAVRRDYAEAAKWCRKGAEQGSVFCQRMLSDMYEQGLGVPQDYIVAYMWLILAAARLDAGLAHEAGTAKAPPPPASFGETLIKDRDKLAAKMTHEQIAEAQRPAREWKPTK
jgi:hypothetical protein